MSKFDTRTLAASSLIALALTACQPDPAQPVRDGTSSKETEAAGPGSTTAMRGDDVVRDFALSNFTSIEQMGADDVKIRQGATFVVQAKGRAQDLDQLNLRVENGKLIIGRKALATLGARADNVDIDIIMPTLAEVTLRGAGDVDVEALSGDVVSATLVGAGELKIKSITAVTANLAISGAGDLDVESGEIDKGAYRLTGVGTLDVEKLKANDLTITSSGVGSITAHASRTAIISLSGTGNVKIKGGAICQTSKSGIGTIAC